MIILLLFTNILSIIDFVLKDDIKKYNYYNDIAQYYINAKENGIKKNINLDKAIEIFYKIPLNYRRNIISDEELEELSIKQNVLIWNKYLICLQMNFK
ncbi:hypothetical protein OGZ02_17220 [Brachyspira hyodysenteriae]|nr:hypothetical protein [Brachyspira hyodysenteriae]MDA1470485.1 hypothetical protein [Brachyspira hyodysenteriae]